MTAELTQLTPRQHEIVLLKHSEIYPSGTNPRKRFDGAKLDKLKGSMAIHGFSAAISHLLVRPVEGGVTPYELVCGERRWRAALALIQEGKLEEMVPAVIQEMSDAWALEMQLIENLNRDDLTPLEEAESIMRMLEIKDEAGNLVNTRETVAVKLGCDEEHVRQMLLICRLRGTKAGDALEAEEIGLKHAQALARVPAGKLRDGLTKRVLKPIDGSSPMPYRQLEQVIRDEFMISLRGADFDQEDAGLVPPLIQNGERLQGGACTDCPFNTKVTGEAAPRTAGMCMNPACFGLKREAAHLRWMQEESAAGRTPLTVAEAQKVFDEGSGKRLAWNSGYVELDAQPSDADLKAGVQGPAWKKLIAGQGVPVVVAKDIDGKEHRLVKHGLALAAARKNEESMPAAERIFKAPAVTAATAATLGEEGSFSGTVQQMEDEEAARMALREREKAARIVDAQFAAVLEAATGTKVPDDFWALALNALCGGVATAGHAEAVAVRHGWVDDYLDADEWYDKGLIKAAKKLNPGERFALMVEMLMWLDLDSNVTLPKWAKAFGVDLKPIKKQIEAEIEQEQKEEEGEKSLVPGMEWLSREPGNFEWVEHEKEAAHCRNPFKLGVKLKAKKVSVVIGVAQKDNVWYAGYEASLGTTGHGFPVMADKGRPTLVQAVLDQAYGVLGWLRNEKAPAAVIEQVSACIQGLLQLEAGHDSPPAKKQASRKGAKGAEKKVSRRGAENAGKGGK